MKPTTMQKAFLALIVANMIWGAAAPIFKLSLENIPPFTLAFWRFFLGSIIMAFILGKRIKYPITSSRDHLLHVVNSLSGITINIIFFFLGLRLTLSINAPVIASTAPIMTFVFALFFLKEKFSFRKVIGMILGVVGIVAIIFEPLVTQGKDGTILGNVFLVIATLGAVIHIITGKKLFTKYDPMALNWWSFIIGTMSFLPLALYEYATIPNLYTSLDIRGYVGLIYGAIFSTACAYTLVAWGLSKISATDTAMFTYIDPVTGAILASLILHEPITTPFLLGTALIFGGIFIAEGRLHYHPIHKLRTPPEVGIAK